MIQTSKLTKHYGELEVLKGIDLSINEKEIVSIVGKSGAGKNKTGLNGKNLIIKVPVGTVILSEDKKKTLKDLSKKGETFKILSGAKGGKGNYRFKRKIKCYL